MPAPPAHPPQRLRRTLLRGLDALRALLAPPDNPAPALRALIPPVPAYATTPEPLKPWGRDDMDQGEAVSAQDALELDAVSAEPVVIPFDRTRQKRPDVKLNGAVPLDLHARALGDMLQAGLTELHIYSLIEAQAAYSELCADQGWVPHAWDAVAREMRRYLDIDKNYEPSFVKGDGDKGRGPVEYRIPPRVTVDPDAAAHLARLQASGAWVHRPQRAMQKNDPRWVAAHERQSMPRDPETMVRGVAAVEAAKAKPAKAKRQAVKISPARDVAQSNVTPLFAEAA